MKKISKTVQRKLYKMYEEAVDKAVGSSVNVSLCCSKTVNLNELWEEAERLKNEFASYLEDGIKEER